MADGDPIALDLPVSFATPDGALPATLLTMRQDEDGGIELEARLDGDTALAAEQAGWFHNPPEGRLREIEGFDPGKPLFVRLALRDGSAAGPVECAAALRDGTAPQLLSESAWNALMVWQETQLDASIGGGVIKHGYETRWTKPRDEIERLRRRGPVSAVMIEAYIENSWPVRLAEDGETLVLGLTVAGRDFRCHLVADDADSVASLVVEYLAEVPDAKRALLEQWIAEQQSIVDPGFFAYAERSAHLTYHCLVQAPPGTLHRAMVEGLVNLGISVMDEFAPSVDEVIGSGL